MRLRIKLTQCLNDPHVQIEIMHGHVIIFRHHQVESNKSRIGPGQLETQQDLREYLLPRQAPQHLVQIVDRNLASRSLPAPFRSAALPSCEPHPRPTGCAPTPLHPPFRPPAVCLGTSQSRRPSQPWSPELPPLPHRPCASPQHIAGDRLPPAMPLRQRHRRRASPSPDQIFRMSQKNDRAPILPRDASSASTMRRSVGYREYGPGRRTVPTACWCRVRTNRTRHESASRCCGPHKERSPRPSRRNSPHRSRPHRWTCRSPPFGICCRKASSSPG